MPWYGSFPLVRIAEELVGLRDLKKVGVSVV
jgi:hypothetical protein